MNNGWECDAIKRCVSWGCGPLSRPMLTLITIIMIVSEAFYVDWPSFRPFHFRFRFGNSFRPSLPREIRVRLLFWLEMRFLLPELATESRATCTRRISRIIVRIVRTFHFFYSILIKFCKTTNLWGKKRKKTYLAWIALYTDFYTYMLYHSSRD